MRASKGYVAGVGTTSALIAAIGCAFAVLSAVVAVHGWPLSLGTPGVATLDGRGAPPAGEALLLPDGAFGVATAAVRVGSGGAPGGRLVAQGHADEPVALAGEPRAPALSPADRGPGTSGPRGQAPAAGPGVRAASPAPAPGVQPVPPSVQPGAGAGGSSTPTPPTSGPASGTGLGSTVTQVTSGAGTTVAQTGQQLGGVVQGATQQVGGVVGQVSPAAGQVVTQTGQLAGGVVSGATGTAGQVVAGAGAAVSGLLGGLGRGGAGRSR